MIHPHGAEPYEFSEAQIARMRKQGKDIEAEIATRARETSRFYRFMIDHVKTVPADPNRLCPAYDPAAGYEITGFVWFQAFNNLVDGNTYPNSPDGKTRNYSKYSEWLADFIRDARTDLDAPGMPFVIRELGVDGVNAEGSMIAFREAMAAPALLSEFKGNVTAVPSAPFSEVDSRVGTLSLCLYESSNRSSSFKSSRCGSETSPQTAIRGARVTRFTCDHSHRPLPCGAIHPSVQTDHPPRGGPADSGEEIRWHRSHLHG